MIRRLLFPSVLAVLLAFLPGCGPKPEFTVLIKMMDIQEEHFKKNVVPPFEKRYNCVVKVVHFDDMWDISDLIKMYENVGLVKTPFEITRELISKGDIKALDDFLYQTDLEQMKKEFFLVALATVEGKVFYVPRKFECRMLVYLKSKVMNAVNHWVDLKDSLNAVLKEINGYGLPHRYQLEADPNQWDFYDVFVAGYYWSHTDYDGKVRPRIAHRAKRYPGTALRLVDRSYQMSGTPDDVLRMDTDPVVDAFLWESLYINQGLFVPTMWKEEWSGGNIWQGFKSGDVFLSFMTQIDCFFIHGTGTKEMPGYLHDPDDMGVAVMPKGVSVELDEYGNYLREGKRAITTGGWWWGIPASSPDPKLSYEFAKWITNTDNQVDGCSNYGMVPVRKDILGDISLMFGGGWITQVFNTAFAQLVENRYTTIPLTPKYGEVGRNYIEAWYDICVGQSCCKTGTPTRENVLATLTEKYVPIQRRILGDEYPGKSGTTTNEIDDLLGIPEKKEPALEPAPSSSVPE